MILKSSKGEHRMFDAIKPLLESGIINEDTQQIINEAWEKKLTEAREQIRAELHEQFAQRYEHDKNVMVEALDRMVTESLSAEIEEFRAERQAMNEDRVRAQQKLRESATKFNDFMIQRLAEEIKEVRQDRKLQMENQRKMEQFIVRALASEIKEFAQDKRAVVEAKVKLVAEGRQQLAALKKRFVKENAKKISAAIATQLQTEMQQLKEDIKIARQNNFGRKIFETFAGEFSVTHLNEKAETRKLMKALQQKDAQLRESQQKIAQATKLVESKEREVRIIRESNQREKIMTDLLAPLNKEKAQTMRSLLESVQTEKLSKTFEKYLPAVLNGNTNTKPAPQKAVLSESSIREVTGEKSAKVEIDTDDHTGRDNVIEIKRLAGL